ncbi:MAG TPA: LPS-assembly protein LptD [Firmicutes bacterium]|nr:LPS-assembly protein LptD [Bacillota bacterium]
MKFILKLTAAFLGVLLMQCSWPLNVVEAAGGTQDGQKAVLTAEEITYDYDGEVIVARGNAELKYQDTVIRCSELKILVKKDQIETSGLTELEQDAEVIFGENLSYNLRQEQGSFLDCHAEWVSETGEPMLMSGEQMEIEGETLKFQSAYFTSCDLENPHYHLTAKQVEYYPGDRIVFYRITYYEGKYPVFYWPKLTYSLKERANNFNETVLGYNETDGWFLKVVYRYYLNSGGDGRLLLDLYQRRGVGEGILHNFQLEEDKELSVSLYHFADQLYFSDDYQLGFDWKHRINSIYDYSLAYEYWLRTSPYDWWDEEYSLYGQLHGRDRIWPFTLTLDTGVDSNYYDPIFYAEPKLNLEWRPTSQTRLAYSGLYDYQSPVYADSYQRITEKYRYALNFYHNWAVYGGDPFKFRVEITESRDLSSEPNPYWRDWNRYPYLSMETPRFNMDFLGDYQVNLDYLRLREVPTMVEGERSEFVLNRQPQPLLEVGNFSLNLIGSLRKQNYWVDQGEYMRRALTFGLEGVQKITPRLTWRNQLTWTEADGAAPTRFYQLVNNSSYYMPYGNFRSGLSYRSAYLQANLAGGYNLSGQKNPWHLMTTSVVWNVNENNRVDFNTSYNPNDREFGLVTLVARYNPDEYNHLRLDLIYNPREEVWSTLDLDAKLKVRLFEALSANVDVLYSFFGDGFERSRFGLIYDWHCRELYVGYDTIREEYSLQFQYKVFPNAGFGFGNSDQGFSYGGN